MFFNNLFKTKKSLKKELSIHKDVILNDALETLKNKHENLPLISAHHKLKTTLDHFIEKRNNLHESWDLAYQNFSWWNKLKYDEILYTPDLDNQIKSLNNALIDFNLSYKNNLSVINKHFKELKIQTTFRIDKCFEEIENKISSGDVKKISKTTIIALGSSALSIPFSISNQLEDSSDVFDILRSVNSNFLEMTDSQIWWETLWMPDESLLGLASLVKGAYLEKLVSEDTGGVLFENFNHPDTDITIDGIEYQIKATDSISYINSVDENIPIIGTSEVAHLEGVIDSGYSNSEISETVNVALDGSAVDAHDVAVDAILSGVGTLGVFATLNGINHAFKEYEKGVDAEEAFFNGLGIAIEGTAKGVVDTSEFLYKATSKVVMSKPSRYLGRKILNLIEKIDS